MALTFFFVFVLFFALVILMCWQESKKRRIAFVTALLLCFLLTPLIAYFIISSRPLRHAKGCPWCGNTYNEVEYCGVCGKNERGESRTKNT